MQHLPQQPTRFINRTDELATLREMLTDTSVRLVTLTGPGGIGKTRLAIAAAEALAREGQFGEGICFVDLSEVGEAEHVGLAIVRALGLSESGRPPAEQLETHLGGRRLFLILDNLEHVIGAAILVGQLLAACPGLVILATSREPLHLRWEHQLRVPPLAVPPSGVRPAWETGNPPAAVALFVDRARAADASFALTPADAEVVGEIVRRLDGLPLAIELVAAHVGTFSLSELLARLWDPSITASEMRDAPARHRSLQAAIEWSHASLGPQEQAVFRQLAVFDGGWTVDAVATILGESAALHELPSLVDKSLVTRDATAGGAARYRLLEPLRMCAATQLSSSGESETMYRRHAEHYARWSEEPDADLSLEESNLRAARRWAHQVEDMDLTRRLAAALARVHQANIRVIDDGTSDPSQRLAGPLSEREAAVLRLIAQGMHSKQIGRELYIAERTVKAHVTSILNKLGADTRSQALGLAVQKGLL